MKALLVILIVKYAAFALPQGSLPQTGKVKGKVTDSASGKIPKVRITFENRESGRKQQIVSDSEGAYEVELPIGDYQVNAEAEGFRPPDAQSIRIESNQTASLNIMFPPIYVNNDPPAVPTRSKRSKRHRKARKGLFYRKAQPNNSLQRSANLLAFICETNSLSWLAAPAEFGR